MQWEQSHSSKHCQTAMHKGRVGVVAACMHLPVLVLPMMPLLMPQLMTLLLNHATAHLLLGYWFQHRHIRHGPHMYPHIHVYPIVSNVYPIVCVLQALRSTIPTPPAAGRAALAQLQKLAKADAVLRPPRFLESVTEVASSGRVGSHTSGGGAGASSDTVSMHSGTAPTGNVPATAASGVAGGAKSELAATRALLAADRDGAALIAACLTVWPFPSAAYGHFAKVSVAAAIVMQPMQIIMQNKVRLAL